MAPVNRDTSVLPSEQPPDTVILASGKYLELQIAALCLATVVVVILAGVLALYLRRSVAKRNHYRHRRLSTPATSSRTKDASSIATSYQQSPIQVHCYDHRDFSLRTNHAAYPSETYILHRDTVSEPRTESVSESIEHGEVRYAHRTRVSLASASTTPSPMASLKRHGVAGFSRGYGVSAESIAAKLNEVKRREREFIPQEPVPPLPLLENREDSVQSPIQFVLSPPTPSASPSPSPPPSLISRRRVKKSKQAASSESEVEILNSPPPSPTNSEASTIPEFQESLDRAFYPVDFVKDGESEKSNRDVTVPSDVHLRAPSSEYGFDSGYFHLDRRYAPNPHDVPALLSYEHSDPKIGLNPQNLGTQGLLTAHNPVHVERAEPCDVVNQAPALDSITLPSRARSRLRRKASLLDSEFTEGQCHHKRFSTVPLARDPSKGRHHCDPRTEWMESLVVPMMSSPKPQSYYDEPRSHFSPPDSPALVNRQWPFVDAAKLALKKAWAKTSQKLLISANSMISIKGPSAMGEETEELGGAMSGGWNEADSRVEIGRNLEHNEQFGDVGPPAAASKMMIAENHDDKAHEHEAAAGSGIRADTPHSRNSGSSAAVSLLPQLMEFPDPPAESLYHSQLSRLELTPHAQPLSPKDDTFTIDSDPFRKAN
ncbi:hypothetical protein FRC02_008030 [Tulasnella sp. 418]|nr:hypothetical protein FRC02_008030 [Tulasnella sp. 418]